MIFDTQCSVCYIAKWRSPDVIWWENKLKKQSQKHSANSPLSKRVYILFEYNVRKFIKSYNVKITSIYPSNSFLPNTTKSKSNANQIILSNERQWEYKNVSDESQNEHSIHFVTELPCIHILYAAIHTLCAHQKETNQILIDRHALTISFVSFTLSLCPPFFWFLSESSHISRGQHAKTNTLRVLLSYPCTHIIWFISCTLRKCFKITSAFLILPQPHRRDHFILAHIPSPCSKERSFPNYEQDR